MTYWPRLEVNLQRSQKQIRKQLIIGAWNICTLLDKEDTPRPHRRTAFKAKELLPPSIKLTLWRREQSVNQKGTTLSSGKERQKIKAWLRHPKHILTSTHWSPYWHQWMTTPHYWKARTASHSSGGTVLSTLLNKPSTMDSSVLDIIPEKQVREEILHQVWMRLRRQ